MTDLVANWDVTLSDGVHRVEFEHGTTTGKRVIRVDNRELHRKDWMFKLVGKEEFTIGKTKCVISIEAVSGFAYEYSLEVNGKSLEKFRENQKKITKSWTLKDEIRITMEKDTTDLYVNGQKIDTFPEFVDDGTETHFQYGSICGYVKITSSGKRRDGLLLDLIVDDQVIDPSE